MLGKGLIPPFFSSISIQFLLVFFQVFRYSFSSSSIKKETEGSRTMRVMRLNSEMKFAYILSKMSCQLLLSFTTGYSGC